MSKRSISDPTVSELFVFGSDQAGRPRGARFLSATEVAMQSAAECGYRAISHPPLGFAEIAMDLPLGQISPTGRLSIPIIEAELFRTIVSAHRQVEHLRHAELHGIASSQLLSAVGLQEVGGTDVPAYPTKPSSWKAVGLGDLVLIHGGPEIGWWDAVVIDRVEDVLKLRLRDDPWQGVFYRHRNAVALINSGGV